MGRSAFFSSRSTAFLVALAVLILSALAASSARADSTPIGALPTGPVSSVRTQPGQFVAVALPRQRAASGARVAARAEGERERRAAGVRG